MSEQSGRSVAITGAGGGLGRDIAVQLAAKGYVVFGTAFTPAEVQELKEASSGRVSLTVCDITKPEAVKDWARGVSEALGNSGLDLLISNAGILTPVRSNCCRSMRSAGSSTSTCSAHCRSSMLSCRR
jgi:NAD(P)-dependent dehydrogenase (short-subunit alcohol dehydrogenase family)